MIPSLPLRPRNRLAETIIAAPHDAKARAQLEALAAGSSDGWLTAGEARFEGRLRERAQAALRALPAAAGLTAGASVAAALGLAGALFDAGLYFEVHEVLEPHWVRAQQAGQREALQGLIQVAVGYQHFADGNLAGARSLLEQGGGRLHGRRVFGIDFEPLARAAVAGAEGLPAAPAPPRFPRAAAGMWQEA
ncbi:MAG TPA: DUF309 domain-containing protein [Candidatus Limnocylindria bacterium]|nr:DUF309 domain-containing protein [Candidatus Limnocylindria bacterium]